LISAIGIVASRLSGLGIAMSARPTGCCRRGETEGEEEFMSLTRPLRLQVTVQQLTPPDEGHYGIAE
jgi:hypothetical protein